MQKNVASQKLIVYAYDATTNTPKTGDAANITAYVSKDFGSVTVLADTSAAELDATNGKGYYQFDLAQAETNADTLLFSAKSSTSNIYVVGVPAVVFTTPPNFSLIDVNATGGVGVDWGNVQNKTTTNNLSSTTVANVSNQNNAAPFLSTVWASGLEPASIGSTTNGTSVDLNTSPVMKCFAVQSVGGFEDEGTLDGKMQESANNSDWSDISGATFTQVDASNNLQQITFTRTMRYVRWRGVIAGGPSIYAAVQVGDVPVVASLTESVEAIEGLWTTQLTESYAADGAAPTAAQALFMALSALLERNLAGTTLTLKKLDGITTAMVLTTNSANQPTSTTRSA